MKIKFKKLHPDAVLPVHAKLGDAGVDLTSISVRIGDESEIEYKTGLAVEIPEGYVGLIFMRSSVYKKDIDLTNAVGVIDSGYRGEISFKFIPNFELWDYALNEDKFQTHLENGNILYYETAQDEVRQNLLGKSCYAVGDRVGQLAIVPYVTIDAEFVDILSETARGTGGHGSTGL